MGLANGVEPRLEQPRARLAPDQPAGLRVSVHSNNCQDTALDQHQQRAESLAASGAGSGAVDLAAQAPWQQQQQAARSVLQRQKQAASRAPQPSAEVPVAVTPMANGLQQGAAAAGSRVGSSSALNAADSASLLRPEPASPVTPASGMEDSRRGPFMRGLHTLRRGSQTPPASAYSAQGTAPPHSTLVSAAHAQLTPLCRGATSALAQAAAMSHCNQRGAGDCAVTCCMRCPHTAAVGCSGCCLQSCCLGTACMLTLLCGRLQSSVSLPGSRLASPEAPFSHQQAASLMYGLPPGLISGASPAGDLHRMQQHIAQLQRGAAPGARQHRRGLSGVPLAQPSGGLVHASQVHICFRSGEGRN